MAEPTELHEALSRYFSAGELRTLCFDLNIEYEDLAGEGKSAKALSLVQYTQRHNRYDDLVAYVQRERPHLQLNATSNYAPGSPAESPSPSPAEPAAGGTVIHIHGNVGAGSVIGGGTIQADHIAGQDIHIGQPPQDLTDFANQLAALKALLEQAIAAGEFENDRDGETAIEDLQDVVEEIESDEPRSNRMSRRLEDVSEILDSATRATQVAGKAGAAIFKAAPIAAALLKAVITLF
jgi:hypothetical protein